MGGREGELGKSEVGGGKNENFIESEFFDGILPLKTPDEDEYYLRDLNCKIKNRWRFSISELQLFEFGF